MSMTASLSMRICGALPIMAAALLLILSCSGCASITEGTTQAITVATDPPNALCSGSRDGALLFQARSGQPVTVSKSHNAIRLTCSAPGFEPTTMVVDSSVSMMGAVGVGIDFGLTDYATGALNKYPSVVTVALKPEAH